MLILYAFAITPLNPDTSDPFPGKIIFKEQASESTTVGSRLFERQTRQRET